MATTDTRPNQRDHILDVALKLMSERGADGMSMRQLASECGVQVAAIYHYFDSKHALLAAVVEERRYGSRLSDPIEQLDRDAPPEDRLRALFGVVWDGALEEEEIWSLLIGEGIRREEAVMQVGRDLLTLVRSASEDWVTELVPEAQPPAAVAELLVGQLITGFLLRVFSADGDDAATAKRIGDERADTLVAAVFG
ncbi:MAG: TetR/AcrR family transcriptional regulator [Actinomycetia bacterium]|nr:TetR/AcrR family transcriptional regulator [Actinomycetes bacterium]